MENKGKVLVLGCGFIGRPLANALYLHGYEVMAVDRDIERQRGLYPKLALADIENSLVRLADGTDFDYVFLMSTPSSNIDFVKDREGSIKSSLRQFSNALMSIGKNTKFIYPSTSSLYGVQNDYAKVKYVFETISESLYPEHFRPRIFAGYGYREEHKGEKASVIFQWLKAVKHDEKIQIYGDGSQSRDFIFVDDIVDSLIDHMEKGTTGLVDIGTGIDTSFNNIVNIMERVTGKHIEVEYTSKPENYLEMTKMTDTANDITQLEKGITITWNYILNNPLI